LSAEAPARPSPVLVARGAIGGGLMGLANLVPGISGGTMLLAAGV
jgi:putative membrane protein